MSLIVRSYSSEYELVRWGAAPSSSSSDLYKFSYGTARQFLSRLNVNENEWRGILMRLNVSIPPNFHHASDILNAVAGLCERDSIRFYTLPKFETFKAVSYGNDTGIIFIKGPKPYQGAIYKHLEITNAKEATDLVASLSASDKELINCLAANGLTHRFSYADDHKTILIEKLVNQTVLAYKVPVYASAPPAKQEELIPATGPGYDKVPLAPESKPTSVNSGPKSLAECEKKLAEARINLDKNGYKPKYTDEQLLEKVKNNSVANERFLVSFQSKTTNPDAKLAYQRESGLVPIWSTSFDQLEYADTDPELIAQVLGTIHDPSEEYVLHIVDRGEDLSGFGQNTLVPTWENMQEPVKKYLSGKHDSQILQEVMTPEYQRQYAEDIKSYHQAGGNEFDEDHQKFYAGNLSSEHKGRFLARHNVRTEIGANSEFTGNGLTQSRVSSSRYGVVETLTLENNPPPISKMRNVSTIALTPRSNI